MRKRPSPQESAEPLGPASILEISRRVDAHLAADELLPGDIVLGDASTPGTWVRVTIAVNLSATAPTLARDFKAIVARKKRRERLFDRKALKVLALRDTPMRAPAGRIRSVREIQRQMERRFGLVVTQSWIKKILFNDPRYKPQE